MKVFKRNFEPIEVEIEDIRGQYHKLTTIVNFTPSVIAKIEEMSVKITSGTKLIVDQMVLFFGRDRQFYENFDMMLLGDVIKHVSEVMAGDSKKNDSGLTNT